MTDTYRHKGLRTKLVEEIKRKGIDDQRILNAIGTVPRHFFIDSAFIEFAYKDNAFPIEAGQTISQPFTVAFQTQLLDVQKDDKILEIGTGSGYQTAILMELGAKVYTIERQRELYVKSQTLLNQMGYRPFFYYGDGYLGLPTYGPYNKILITAATDDFPSELKKQLKIGGIIVAPIGNSESQRMTTLIKISDHDFKKTEFGNFVFVPLLKGIAK
jgi:protein-L-isoaspartate(D-aspartate) O-methyltransferase